MDNWIRYLALLWALPAPHIVLTVESEIVSLGLAIIANHKDRQFEFQKRN